MGIKNNSTTIIDSSGLISLLVESDTNHFPAKRVLKKMLDKNSLFIIPSDVFSETINIAGKKLGHQQAVMMARQILENQTFLLTEETSCYQAALDQLQISTTSISFTDCLVMATADKYQTKLIFGFDKVFAQKGYSLL